MRVRTSTLCGTALMVLLAAQAVAPARTQSAAPVQVFVKTTFADDAVTFKAEGNGAVALGSGADQALDGRSLALTRKAPGGYFGALLDGLTIDGSPDLRVAFALRADGMRDVTVNLFDQARSDNTTPASPARVDDGEWRTVVFHAEDFHYNSAPPDQKIAGGERFVSLFIHGREESDTPRIWIDNLVVYRGPDRTRPDAPSGLAAEAAADGVTLRWTAPADDTIAAIYSIHRQSSGGPWIKVGESLRPSFVDRPPAPGTYRYRVTAADYENNVSAPSAEVETTTAGGSAPGAVPGVVRDRLGYAAHVREVHARGRGTVRPGVFLFAGDSITGAASYTHILGAWLARGQTVRQGVASVTTEYGAANIAQYLADARPEFAVVMYGTNDRGDGRGSAQNLAAVVDACVANGTVPIIATIPPRGFLKRQSDIERFNQALVTMARDRQVPVSYAFEEMMQHDLRDILDDGIHLTPEAGNDAAGRALRRTMDQVYFALRDE